MLLRSFCILLLDILVGPPMSLRHKDHHEAGLYGADDAEEDEEAYVAGEADDGRCDLDRDEDHEKLVADEDHADQQLEVGTEPFRCNITGGKRGLRKYSYIYPSGSRGTPP